VGVGEVGDLTIDPKEPIPTIINPGERAFVATGGGFDAQGQGFDFQDGTLPDSALQWLVDGRVVGTGRSVSTGALASGQHTLTMRATNSAGLVGTSEVTVTVGADVDRDGLPDAWEVSVGLDSANAADAYGDIDGDATLNWQECELGSDPKDPASPSRRSFEETLVVPVGDPVTSSAQPGWFGWLYAGIGVAVTLVVAGLIWLRRRRRLPAAG
jgi:hypothetical protein